MRLYLVQHGEAVDKNRDPDRPLTSKGFEEVASVGSFLGKHGLSVHEIWHSGRNRACQTAEVLLDHLCAECGLKKMEGLGPNDPTNQVWDALSNREGDLVLVGHLPYLDKLASRLLTGDEEAGVIAFQKGGVVCLECDETGKWRVHWMIGPNLVMTHGAHGRK